MSNSVYPTGLGGLAMEATKDPEFSTLIQRAVSGKELRIAERIYPIWRHQLKYNFLRDSTSFPELKSIGGFYLARLGPADSFLFADPDDSSVVAQGIGTGNAALTQLQLLRSFGNFTEPVFNIQSNPYVLTTNVYGGSARMNLFKKSAAFAHATWIKSNVTMTDNAATAPNGTSTGTSMAASASADGYVYQDFVTTTHANLNYVLSCWIKAGTASGDVNISLQDGANVPIAAASFTPTGSWQRVSVSGTFGATPAPNVRCVINPVNDVPTIGQTWLLWGPQLEQEVVLSSGYIGTDTTYYLPAVDLTTGVVTWSAPVPNACPVIWTGSYYYRSRFDGDRMSFKKFMYQLWELGKVDLVSSLQDKI